MTYKRLQVGIKPRNLEQSFAFYQDALGLPYLGALHTTGIVLHRFEAGGATLKLLESPAVELDNPPGTPGDAHGLRWLTLEVNDLQTLLARLETKNVLPKFPMTTDDNGVSYVILEDPDGIWVELMQMR